MRVYAILLISIMFGSMPYPSYSQACCSAGTPLLSSMDVSTTPAGSGHLAVTYVYNQLQDVFSGSEKIEGFRQRLSQSLIWELSYGINQRWSVTGIFSWQQQTRRLNSPNQQQSLNRLTTDGMGDALILIKYNILPLNIIQQRQIALGAGLKLPTGKSNLRDRGFLLPADMQPGTGSWDGVFWAYLYQGFLPKITANIFLNTSFRLNGTNNRYGLENSDFSGYRFGNEWVVNVGGAYRTLSRFDFSIVARYRQTAMDEFGGVSVSNTGGRWLYVSPGVNLNFSQFSLRFSGEWPVYRKLNGVQLTTSYKLDASIFYQLQF
ncbi:MAG: hypothetical protein GF313_00615 [Caldithrix sp.]|nr:hypothetical protein [Caldithrix sp.]